MKKAQRKPIYVMIDLEASGPNLARHTLLSWGACVVLPVMKSAEEMKSLGLVYYDELKPLRGRGFLRGAMEVGCLGLRCLEKFKDDRAVAHCAEDDAIYLARLAAIALYKNCR